MLKISNVSKSYANNSVLNDCTTSFDATGISIIVGVNGSGKTTLFNIVASLIQADSGDISIDGLPVGSTSFKEHLFYLPSDFYLPQYMTGREYGNFIMSRYPTSDRKMFNMVVEVLGLKNAQHQLIESYSFGMKKKIVIAAGLSVGTSYLLADEPFSGLDFETSILVQEIFELWGAQHKLVIVSHDSSMLTRFPDDIRLMENGQLEPFKGSAQDLPELIRKGAALHGKLDQVAQYFCHS